MSINDQEIRINAFATLGDHLLHPDEELIGYIRQANKKNAWFTEEQTTNAVKSVGKLLNRNDLSTWTGNYKFATSAKKIGLVLAGNIPMVGFHDILAVLISGNIALIKLSSNDDILIPRILERLTQIEPTFSPQIKLVERLEGFDAIIATGSNNTSRYFEYYFSKVPHIIRKNRNSIAILSGNETTEELKALGRDIFDYFGLGCRNVSKLFVPLGYNFTHFFEAIEEYSSVKDHHKYNNNYDYNKSIFLVNKTEHLDNGFLLVTKSKSLHSPLAVVFYEEYQELESLKTSLENKKDEIQVLVTQINDDFGISKTHFGNSQQPALWDYADGIDTLKFLSSLN